MTGSTAVLVDEVAGVLKLTLNRPDKLNSFNEEMHFALRAQLQRAHDRPEIRAVLLTGAGRAFCAGQDLGQNDPRLLTEAPDLGHTIETYFNPTLRLLRDLKKPVIAAVNGAAAGAGANLALACDIVFAAHSAKFVQAFAKIALVPDAGGSWTLTRILGEPRAKALMLTGEPLSAEKAEQWGLIWKAVEDDKLADAALAYATALAAGPTLALGLTKQLIQSAGSTSFDAHLDLERDAQRTAGFSADHTEGLLAFFDKRAPNFTGN